MKRMIVLIVSVALANVALAEFTCSLSVGKASSALGTREGVVKWKNTDGVAIDAPYVRVDAGDRVFVRFTEADQWAKSLEFLATSPGAQASSLKGFEKGELSFLCKSSSDDDTMELSYTLSSSEAFPWSEIGDSLKPSFVSDAAWAFALKTLKVRLGTTWNSYLGRFRADADYLASSGRPVNRMDRLWQFEINRALGIDPAVSTLASAVDAACSARGLGPTLSRSYSSAMYTRFGKGMFGYGWTDNLSVYAELTDATTLTFHMPGGSAYSFTKVTGNWAPEDARDKSTLVETSSAYVLTYQNGTKQTFAKANMRTSSITDNSGNTLTFTWNGTQLSKVTHTDGQSLTFAYSSGLITSVTDDCGRKTTYAYSSELLTSVTAPDGLVTRYEYRAADGTVAARALSHIVYPDGTTKEFEYDAEGLVASVSINGGKEKTSILRADGVVTLVQPDGGKTVVKTGVSGEPLETKDALGGTSVNGYTEDGLLKSMTSPSGLSGSISHDALGRVAKSVSAGGNATAFSYEETFGNLKSVTDAKSHAVTYGYDAKGRGTSVSFPDGSMSRVEYNDRGDVVKSYNRRGESISYTYDAKGRVTKKTWSTGRTFTYAYDAHGNVTTATDSETGSVTMEYDAADRMTKIVYPNGCGFTFAYDLYGRLVRRNSFDGTKECFVYDAQGRLASVTDGEGNLYLRTVYDETTGRVIRQENGNGTSTTYLYDKLGRTTSIEHLNADGKIVEALQYCYDVDGRCIRASSLLGEERYAYDDDGQLTKVNYPNDTYQSFAYDAVGNRTASNKATYTVNAMNQYTQAEGGGEVTTFAYDADGNMISMMDSNGTITYTYDTLNRLVAVKNASAGIDWKCKYDVFGNRVSVTENGVTTERVYLQGALPSVAAEYVNGQLKERHILVGAVRIADINGEAASSPLEQEGAIRYLHADLIGSVRLVTGEDGTVHDRASYLAFGGLRTGSMENSAGYVGTLGVETDSTGLLFMRNRYYSPALGRFIQMDPIGFNGGDENLYRYCGNAPVVFYDIEGKELTFAKALQFSKDFAEGFFDGVRKAAGFVSDVSFGVAVGATAIGPVGAPVAVAAGMFATGFGAMSVAGNYGAAGIRGENVSGSTILETAFLGHDIHGLAKHYRAFGKGAVGAYEYFKRYPRSLISHGVTSLDMAKWVVLKNFSGTMNDFYDMSGEIAKALGADGLEDITWSEGGMIYKDASLASGSCVRLAIPQMQRPKKTQYFIKTLSATVEGPCKVSFGMRMSDYMLLDETASLIFAVDGQSIGGTEIIYSSNNLTQFGVTIKTSGSHRIEWYYSVSVYSYGPSTAGPFYADIANVSITKLAQAMMLSAGSPACVASALPNDVDSGPRIFSYDRYVLARGYDYSFDLSAESGAGLSVSGLPEGFSFSDGRIIGAANDISEGEITIVSSKGSAKGEKRVPFVVVDEPPGFDIQYNGGSPDLAFYEDEEYPDAFYLYNVDGSRVEDMIFNEGDSLGFWMCFANMNWGTLARPFRVRLQCSNGVSYDYSVDRLSAGQYLGGWFDLPDVFQGMAPGSYSLTCVLDPDDAYEETDELNNSRSVDFTIDELRVEFLESAVFAGEGGKARVTVRGGKSNGSCDVKLYLASASADAKDLDLTKLTVDGAIIKNAKFPLTLSWETGDVSTKVIEIPIKTDTTVEGYEQFDLQLADANGIALGDVILCSVSVKDESVGATLAQAVNNPSIKVATTGDGKWTAANGNEGFLAGDRGMYHLQSPALAAGKSSTLNLSGVSGSGKIAVAYRFVGDYTGGKSASLRLLADKKPLQTDAVLYHSSVGSTWNIFTITDSNKGSHTYSYVFTQGDNPDVHVEVAMAKWVPAGGSEPVMVYVSSNGSGYGTVSGMGFYAIGATAKITAKPAPGRQFAGWYRYSSANQKYELYDRDHTTLAIKVTESLDMFAVFVDNPYVRAVAFSADGGKVTGSGYCAEGKKVTLKATANKNNTFIGWYASKVDDRNAIDESRLIATTASLVIDRSAKPKANSKTSTTITDLSGDATYFALFKSDPKVSVLVAATDGNVNAGKITGVGKYAPGKKVTLKATANKGYVFNGWYGDGLVSQAASWSFEMPDEDVAYEARFVTTEVDKASVKASFDGSEILPTGSDRAVSLAMNVTCGVYAEFPLAASALSQTTISVSGLPSGLKWTAKDILKKGSKTEVEVPANTIYGVPTAASKVDAKTKKIKPSTVKITVTTAGKSKVEYVLSLTVDPLPTWLVGSFVGGDAEGQLSITVGSNGKISGKYLSSGKSYSLSATSFSGFDAETGVFVAEATMKVGTVNKSLILTFAEDDEFGAIVQCEDSQGATTMAYLNRWKDPVWKVVGSVIANKTCELANGTTLKFSANGTVKISVANGRKTYSGSAVLITFGEPSADGFDGMIWGYVPPSGTAYGGWCELVKVRWDGSAFTEIVD